jgi:hypothetical protein
MGVIVLGYDASPGAKRAREARCWWSQVANLAGREHLGTAFIAAT